MSNFKNAFRPILERSFLRADYEGDPRKTFSEGAKELERLVPDALLRHRVRTSSILLYPIDKNMVFIELTWVLNIIGNPAIRDMSGKIIINNPVCWYNNCFDSVELSKDYLLWLLDFFIIHEYHEGIVIVNQRLANEGLLDEPQRFVL